MKEVNEDFLRECRKNQMCEKCLRSVLPYLLKFMTRSLGQRWNGLEGLRDSVGRPPYCGMMGVVSAFFATGLGWVFRNSETKIHSCDKTLDTYPAERACYRS